MDANLGERGMNPEGAEVGGALQAPDGLDGLQSTFRTPGGLPCGLSSSPSTPCSTHRLNTLWTVERCTLR